jgi:RNA polymerase sigma-70 factor (ECF subfamily)
MSKTQLLSNYYTQHREDLVRYLTVLTADADQAQDMVQDLFLRLLSGSQLISPQTLPALVYTMARHAATDYRRRRQVFETYERTIRRGDSTDDCASVVSVRLLTERIERSLARLSEDSRKIYRLHIYDGMKVREISHELMLPYKQVENRLGQARKVVRQQLRACV